MSQVDKTALWAFSVSDFIIMKFKMVTSTFTFSSADNNDIPMEMRT
jgi:hypothetical protein